jgi:hypothetical protein
VTARRVGLGIAFVAWFYGVPFVVIDAAGRWIAGSRTGPFHPLYWGLGLDVVVPVAGAVVAALARDRFWLRHFQFALMGALVYFLVLVALLSVTSRSLPDTPGPSPEVSHCVQYSGAPANCPGG